MTDRLILFDIDGTLVHVAEELAFARAMHEHCGGPVDLSFAADMVISDDGYVRGVLRRAGLAHGDADVDAALERFVSHLCAAIDADESPVRPIAGAAALLAALQARRAPIGLATGCIEPSARAKLTAVGLHEHFPCGGFSRREQAREEILARAVASAADHYGRRFAPAAVTYVGDGVWDIAASRAIGAQFIGVNERHEGRERLRAAGATIVLEDYSDTAAVLAALLDA
jgi:phosphoglycolate phosphatase-like HAD superfamily hydrolase